MARDPVYRIIELRSLEKRAGAHPLMERAGLAAAEIAREMLAGRSPRVQVLAGPGNNGGDAFVVARWLKSWYFDVDVAFAGEASSLGPDAASALRAWQAAGGRSHSEWHCHEPGLIIDGLFGIGLARSIGESYAKWITRANENHAPVLALDIPSGLDADTGHAQPSTIRASGTATFIALKPGLLTADGPDHCGTITVHTLGLDVENVLAAQGERLRWESVRDSLPGSLRRTRHNEHKGTFGTLAIVGGGEGLVGAALLAGRAAAHVGAGKVRIGLASVDRLLVDVMAPELMLDSAARVLDMPCDALVVGPGLGTRPQAHTALESALANASPLVIDADALNLVAADAKLASALAARGAATILTPHPAEAARLLQRDTAAVQRDRVASTLELAKHFNASVVLKGAGSVLAFVDGTWAINASGNVGLSSGGTGDVLAGMIGALLAQRIAAPEALKLAVCLHGAAADALVRRGEGPAGLTASELAPAARALINQATASLRANK